MISTTIRNLRVAVAEHLAAMQANPKYEDGSAIYARTHWVARNRPAVPPPVNLKLTNPLAYFAVITDDIQRYAVSPKPIPKPGFLDSCEPLGYIYGERRWRSPDGQHLLTWDGLHGEIEVFDKRGQHLSVLDATTGTVIKPRRKGRRIRV